MASNDALKSFYKKDVEAQLGSFVSHDDKYEGQRTYYGRSSDFAAFKQKCNYVESGSVAVCVDTRENAMFDETTKQWYQEGDSK